MVYEIIIVEKIRFVCRNINYIVIPVPFLEWTLYRR